VCELICKIPDAGVFFVKILDEEKEREREREREEGGGRKTDCEYVSEYVSIE